MNRKEITKHKKKKSNKLRILFWDILVSFVAVLVLFLFSLGGKGIGEILNMRDYWLSVGVANGLILIGYLMMYRVDAQNIAMNENDLEDTEWLTVIAQLQMLKVRINRGNDEIMQIDKDISVLSVQESLFTTLYSENSFNEDLYFEKTDTIKKKISELKTRRAHLVSEDDDERCIERLRELKRNLQQFPVGITEFDKDIFNGIIKQIYIEESGAITFVLKGDLEFSAEV